MKAQKTTAKVNWAAISAVSKTETQLFMDLQPVMPQNKAQYEAIYCVGEEEAKLIMW